MRLFKSRLLTRRVVFVVIIVVELLVLVTILFFLLRNTNSKKTVVSTNEVLHPYLGYVDNLKTEPWLNPLGFNGELIKKNASPNEYVVIITGGSVSEQYFEAQKEELGTQIQQLLKNEKKVVVYSFGLGAYKQPQQLFVLNYLLALGYKVDLVINIDGFNEAAIPYAANYQNGISTYYPWFWEAPLINTEGNRATYLATIKLEFIKKVALFFNSLPMNLGAAAGSVTGQISNKIQLNLMEYLKGLEKGYGVTGPEPYMNLSKNEIMTDIVNVWFNSSLQMDKLAKANKIKYLEFLQPNQYLPNTKKFSEEEKEKYVKKDNAYAYATGLIYPQMIKKTDGLKKEGVSVYDLTEIFKNYSETLYNDDCCHYSSKGYALMTPYIMEAVAKEM